MAVKEETIKTVFDVAEAKLGYKFNQGQHFYGGDVASNDDPVEKVIGATVYKIKNGQRLPTNVQTNNPALEMPSKLGMTLFGQSPIWKIAMDQVIGKKVGVFGNATNGAGLSGFNFTNLPIFGGSMQMTDAIATMMTGGNTSGLSSGLLVSHINDVVSQVGSLVGASGASLIELNNKDHAIPFLNALSTVFGGGSSGFSIDTFANGMKLAQAATDYLTNLAGGQVAYGKILENVGSAALGQVSAATSSVNVLGGVVGAPVVPPVVKQGTQILAHIIKAQGQF